MTDDRSETRRIGAWQGFSSETRAALKDILRMKGLSAPTASKLIHSTEKAVSDRRYQILVALRVKIASADKDIRNANQALIAARVSLTSSPLSTFLTLGAIAQETEQLSIEEAQQIYGLHLQGLRSLIEWTNKYIQIADKPSRGRPPMASLKIVIEDLASQWSAAGLKPTLRTRKTKVYPEGWKTDGPFFEYVTHSLSPLLPPDYNKSLERSIRYALEYSTPKNNGRKST